MGPEETLQLTRATKAKHALWRPPTPEPADERPKLPKRQRVKPRYEFEPCEHTPIHRNAHWVYAMRLDANRPPLIEDIIKAVCKHYKINQTTLLSAKRSRWIVRPRQIGMYLAKELTSRSLPEIGRRFGNRDHTTVLHATRRIEQLLREDPETLSGVCFLRLKLRGRP